MAAGRFAGLRNLTFLCLPALYLPALYLAALYLAAFALAAQATPHRAVESRHGMVVSSSELATGVGAKILGKGGNAIDAAVATGFALAVTYPTAGNLGGGGFMVIHLADGTVVTNDHRETAPAGATQDMFLDDDGALIDGLSTRSHLAAGVPGTVDGLLSVLARHGSLPRDVVLAPAIRLAQEGFALPADVARDLARFADRFAAHPGSRQTFLRADGSPHEAGDHFRQPALAATLVRIAEQGRDGFYAGETADLLVAEMARGRGLISEQDLAAYRSVWREPVAGRYRGHDVYGMGPPSSGGILIQQMLNMLEPFDLNAKEYGSAAAVHLMVEVARRAYADRAMHLGDADFVEVPLVRLLDPAYARQRFADFKPERATASAAVGAGYWPEESADTTHVSVMDASGNAVSYTTTLNLAYGSKIVVEGAGFLLNNEMDDFSIKPGVPNAYGLIGGSANAIEPGKRMLSSMSPTIVSQDGRPWLVTGSPGGSTIITVTLQVLLNSIDHHMGVADAVARPRIHHQWWPDRIVHERWALSPDTIALLRERGHPSLLRLPPGRGIGDANSIVWRDELFYGKADPRGPGVAAGPTVIEPSN